MSVPPEPSATPATPGGQPPQGGLPVPVIPDHTPIRKIAEGSYGEIWLARNIMGTLRAVKILYRKRFAHERPYEREYEGIQRFEPISRSHEGFVDILHMGRNDAEGYFYYVMELGDDRDLGQEYQAESYLPKTLASEVIGRGRLPIEECLHLALTITDALRQLHEHGLTHRDIKPSNIIFVNGTPKLADIGLVADIGHDRSYVGTEGFIAPEGPGTPQADLFSLGKVLYEMSTGKDRNDFPELPDNFDSFPDAEAFREFNEVVIRACHGDRDQRYSTARKMYAELAVIINGDSVRRLRHLERRLNLIRHTGAVVLLLAIIGGVIGYPVYRGYQMRQEARERSIGSSISEGTAAMKQGLMPSALSSFAKALQLTAGMGKREEDNRLRCAATFVQCPKLVQMGFADSPVGSVMFHPDGRQALVTLEMKAAKILDLQSGSYLPLDFGWNQKPYMAAYSPDGKYVATAGEKYVRIWDAFTGEMLKNLPHSNWVFSVSFSSDGRQLVAATQTQGAMIWDIQGHLLAELPGHKDEVRAACFSPDQRYVVTGCNDGMARVWKNESGYPQLYTLRHGKWVQGIAFSPDGKYLATAVSDRKTHLWDLETGLKVPPTMPHADNVQKVMFSPDGRFLLTASADGVAQLWDSSSHLLVAKNSLFQSSDRIADAAFNAEGNRIIIGCNDGTVRVWDISNLHLPLPEGPAYLSADLSHSLEVNPAAIKIKNLRSGAEKEISRKSFTAVRGMQLTEDGRWLLGFQNEKTNSNILLHDTAASGAETTILDCPNPINFLAVAPQRYAFCVYQQNHALIIDIEAGRVVSSNLYYKGDIAQASYIPPKNQCFLAVWKFFCSVDPQSGELLKPLLDLSLDVKGMAFSPDGKSFVAYVSTSGWEEGYARRFDTATHRPLTPHMRHRDGVLHAVFSPNGSKIATGSEDSTARIWDAKTGQPLTSPLPHADHVTCVDFSPDGRWLLTVCRDHNLRLWDVETGDPLTPPVEFPVVLSYGRFLADRYQMLAGWAPYSKSLCESNGNAWTLSFPQDLRPIGDWQNIAYLLSGAVWTAQQATDQQPIAIRRQKLRDIWLELQTKYPRDFSTSSAELLHWHQQEAIQAQAEENGAAALFHLQWMLKHEPTNAFARQHIAEIRKRLPTDTIK